MRQASDTLEAFRLRCLSLAVSSRRRPCTYFVMAAYNTLRHEVLSGRSSLHNRISPGFNLHKRLAGNDREIVVLQYAAYTSWTLALTSESDRLYSMCSRFSFASFR